MFKLSFVVLGVGEIKIRRTKMIKKKVFQHRTAEVFKEKGILGKRGKICIGALILALGITSLAMAQFSNRMDEMVEVKNHFEFLGYTVIEGEDLLRCKHLDHMSISVQQFKSGILFVNFFSGSEYSKTHRTEFLEFCNSLNAKAVMVRAYVDKDGDLVLEGWFMGTYERQRFGGFIEIWHRDTERLLTEEVAKAKKLLR